MGSTGGSYNQSQGQASSQPWSAQQPYLKDIYRTAQGISDVPLDYYPGATVAGQDPSTLAGLGMMEQRAADGSPLLGAAQGEAQKVLGGDYLNSNPYLDATFDRAASGVTRNFNRAVLPNLESRFAGAGRLGSGAHQGAVGEAGRALAGELGGMATDIYGGNYARERGMQQSMVGMAPGLAQADYGDAQMMMNAGAARQGYSQSVLDDLIQRFEFNRDEPYNRAAQYSTLIGAPVNQSQSSQSSFGFGTQVCWVAAEYFGFLTPDWWTARQWILEGWQGLAGDIFRKLYVKYGERLAAVVRRNRLVRAALRPLFEWCLRMGKGMN
jgi:hypothetical protein